MLEAPSHGQVEQTRHVQRPAVDHAVERRAVEQLHGDEVCAVVLVDLVDRADVRMIQGRGGARLAEEALERLRIVRAIRRQELQRHCSRQPDVLSFVYDAHTAGAERFQHPVVGDRLVDHDCLESEIEA